MKVIVFKIAQGRCLECGRGIVFSHHRVVSAQKGRLRIESEKEKAGRFSRPL